MSVTILVKASIAMVPALMLIVGSAILFSRKVSASTLLQLLGSGCFVVVVFAHVCEALQLLSWMHWGSPDSAGHYVDLASALAGATLFPLGYLFHAFRSGLQ